MLRTHDSRQTMERLSTRGTSSEPLVLKGPTHAHIHTYAQHTHTHIYTCIHIHIYTTHTYTIHTYTHIHMHTYTQYTHNTHTYTHAHITHTHTINAHTYTQYTHNTCTHTHSVLALLLLVVTLYNLPHDTHTMHSHTHHPLTPCTHTLTHPLAPCTHTLTPSTHTMHTHSHHPLTPYTQSTHTHSRLMALIRSTRGNVVFGGDMDEQKLKINLTLITDVTPGDPTMEDEIFGPILPFVPVDSIDEAINLVNSKYVMCGYHTLKRAAPPK